MTELSHFWLISHDESKRSFNCYLSIDILLRKFHIHGISR